MRLTNKTALITGGNSGIGLATAQAFVAEGARVAITGRNPETLAKAAELLGPKALTFQFDITDVEQHAAAFHKINEALGGLDIVFANAGIGATTPLGQTTLADFDKLLRTNLTAVFFTVQSALPYLRDGGSVILNGSVHAVLGMPGWSAYAATKAGVRAMARNFAAELAPRRIRVNQVTPGGTRTPIWNAMAPTPDLLAGVEARLAARTPLERMSEAEEIAAAVLYLASDESRNTTAQEIVVDGGATGAPAGAPMYR